MPASASVVEIDAAVGNHQEQEVSHRRGPAHGADTDKAAHAGTTEEAEDWENMAAQPDEEAVVCAAICL